MHSMDCTCFMCVPGKTFWRVWSSLLLLVLCGLCGLVLSCGDAVTDRGGSLQTDRFKVTRYLGGINEPTIMYVLDKRSDTCVMVINTSGAVIVPKGSCE